jgi:hypothetical protein
VSVANVSRVGTGLVVVGVGLVVLGRLVGLTSFGSGGDGVDIGDMVGGDGVDAGGRVGGNVPPLDWHTSNAYAMTYAYEYSVPFRTSEQRGTSTVLILRMSEVQPQSSSRCAGVGSAELVHL